MGDDLDCFCGSNGTSAVGPCASLLGKIVATTKATSRSVRAITKASSMIVHLGFATVRCRVASTGSEATLLYCPCIGAWRRSLVGAVRVLRENM